MERLRTLLLPLLALILATGLAACADPDDDAAAEEVGDETAAEEGPDLIGQELTVSGDVSEVLAPGLFVIEGEDFAFDYEGTGTLVIAPDNPTVQEGGVAQVNGTVQVVLLTQLRDEFGMEFDEDLLVEFDNELALKADSVEFIPQGEDDEAGLEAGGPLIAGEHVALGGTVQEVLSPNAFVMHADETDTDVLVLNADATGDITEGMNAQVQGDVVEFVIATIEDDLGIDLDDELFVEFEQETAVVAESMEFVPDD